ncbi:hypothetical protein SNEBB_010319 [Seison nebaliae]|nr:hypothetical protein SNEBB_010319 [Seison nebaliae]
MRASRRTKAIAAQKADATTLKEDFRKRKNMKGETKLHIAVVKDDFDKTKTLLEEGYSANTRDYAGWTPLHEAASNCNVPLCRLLLEYSAVTSGEQVEGGGNRVTPLHEAMQFGDYQIIEMLIEYGANLHCQDSDGMTPLDYTSDEKTKTFAIDCKRLDEPYRPFNNDFLDDEPIKVEVKETRKRKRTERRITSPTQPKVAKRSNKRIVSTSESESENSVTSSRISSATSVSSKVGTSTKKMKGKKDKRKVTNKKKIIVTPIKVEKVKKKVGRKPKKLVEETPVEVESETVVKNEVDQNDGPKTRKRKKSVAQKKTTTKTKKMTLTEKKKIESEPEKITNTRSKRKSSENDKITRSSSDVVSDIIEEVTTTTTTTTTIPIAATTITKDVATPIIAITSKCNSRSSSRSSKEKIEDLKIETEETEEHEEEREEEHEERVLELEDDIEKEEEKKKKKKERKMEKKLKKRKKRKRKKKREKKKLKKLKKKKLKEDKLKKESEKNSNDDLQMEEIDGGIPVTSSSSPPPPPPPPKKKRGRKKKKKKIEEEIDEMTDEEFYESQLTDMPNILLTGLSSVDRRGLNIAIRHSTLLPKHAFLNGELSLQTDVFDATHVICSGQKSDLATRTINYFRSILRGNWIVSTRWLIESAEQNQWLSPAPYELKGSVKFPDSETPKRSRLARENFEEKVELLNCDEHNLNECGEYVAYSNLFDGLTFFIETGSYPVDLTDIILLIVEGGGKFLRENPLTDYHPFWHSNVEKIHLLERNGEDIEDLLIPSPIVITPDLEVEYGEWRLPDTMVMSEQYEQFVGNLDSQMIDMERGELDRLINLKKSFTLNPVPVVSLGWLIDSIDQLELMRFPLTHHSIEVPIENFELSQSK